MLSRARMPVAVLCIAGMLLQGCGWIEEHQKTAIGAGIGAVGGAAVGFVMVLWDMKRFPFQDFIVQQRERYVPTQKVNEYSSTGSGKVYDAKYYDVREPDQKISQARIDEILDKISQSGYQSLSDEEKKILFDASKKLN